MTAINLESSGDMFRPPACRAMRPLDRAFFQKRIPICAARVLDNKSISRCRSELLRSQDLLKVDRVSNVRADPFEGVSGRRCLLLKPEIKEQGEHERQLNRELERIHTD